MRSSPGGGRPRGHAVARTSASMVVGLATIACSAGGGDPAPTTDGDGDGSGGSGSFSVLTYNVAGLPQEISSENPEEHIPLISPLLDEYDLVLTQEDFDWWTPLLDDFDFVHYHERLRAEATHEHRSAQHPGPEAAGLDPATRPDLNVGDGLGTLSRFPLADETRTAWTGCFGGLDTSDGGAGDCLAMKGFSHATITLAEGVAVDLYNLHAEAGGTDEDQRLQTDDFDQLAAYIETHSAGRPIILAGDTNLHTAGDHPDGGGGADAQVWDDFLAHTGLVGTCTEDTGCTEPGSIDKIAVRSTDTLTLAPTAHTMPRDRFTSPAGDPLSDHPPVVVELDWQATPT